MRVQESGARVKRNDQQRLATKWKDFASDYFDIRDADGP